MPTTRPLFAAAAAAAAVLLVAAGAAACPDLPFPGVSDSEVTRVYNGVPVAQATLKAGFNYFRAKGYYRFLGSYDLTVVTEKDPNEITQPDVYFCQDGGLPSLTSADNHFPFKNGRGNTWFVEVVNNRTSPTDIDSYGIGVYLNGAQATLNSLLFTWRYDSRKVPVMRSGQFITLAVDSNSEYAYAQTAPLLATTSSFQAQMVRAAPGGNVAVYLSCSVLSSPDFNPDYPGTSPEADYFITSLETTDSSPIDTFQASNPTTRPNCQSGIFYFTLKSTGSGGAGVKLKVLWS